MDHFPLQMDHFPQETAVHAVDCLSTMLERYEDRDDKWNKSYKSFIDKLHKNLQDINANTLKSYLFDCMQENILIPYRDKYTMEGFDIEEIIAQGQLEMLRAQKKTYEFELDKATKELERITSNKREKIESNKAKQAPRSFVTEAFSKMLDRLLFSCPKLHHAYFPIESEEDQETNPENHEILLNGSVSIVFDDRLYKFFEKDDFGYNKNCFLKITYFSYQNQYFDSNGKSFLDNECIELNNIKHITDLFCKTMCIFKLLSLSSEEVSHYNDFEMVIRDNRPIYTYLNILFTGKKTIEPKIKKLNPSYLYYAMNNPIDTKKIKIDPIKKINAPQVSNTEQKIVKYLHLLTSPYITKHSMCLNYAFDWYFNSMLTQQDNTSTIMKWIAIEAILGDENPDRLVDKLSDRYSYLIGKNSNERNMLKKFFKKQYDIRSKLMHGRSSNLEKSKDKVSTNKSTEIIEQILLTELENLASSQDVYLKLNHEESETPSTEFVQHAIKQLVNDFLEKNNLPDPSKVDMLFGQYKVFENNSINFNYACRIYIENYSYFCIVTLQTIDGIFKSFFSHGPFLENS